MSASYSVHYTEEAKEDLLFWSRQDPKTLKRIIRLIENIESTPFTGIGKPEDLRHALSGAWSRRIDTTNRLVYEVDDKTKEVWILQARFHY